MRESQLRLRDKTIVVAGPFSQLTQSLTTTLTEQGSDVAIVTAKDHFLPASKFAENVSTGREINPMFGRSVALDFDICDDASVKDCISRVAEVFGGIDIVVDTYLTTPSKESALSELKKKSHHLMDGALPFLTGRKKGRIITTFFDVNSSQSEDEATLTETKTKISTMGSEVAGTQVTVNGLSMGPTEDYLLQAFPDSANIQTALKELQKTNPNQQIIDTIEVANVVMFMASPMSNGLNGQVLRVNGGFN